MISNQQDDYKTEGYYKTGGWLQHNELTSRVQKNYLGKVYSKEKLNDLKIRKFNTEGVVLLSFLRVFVKPFFLMQRFIKRFFKCNVLCFQRKKKRRQERGKGERVQRPMLKYCWRYHHQVKLAVINIAVKQSFFYFTYSKFSFQV